MGVAYVNGRYVLQSQAYVSIDDRGFQFADSVYEVVALVGSRWIDLEWHFERLYRSCREIDLPFSHKASSLIAILQQLQRRNRLVDGLLYIQVTRGVAPRGHIYTASLVPTLIITLKPFKFKKHGDPLEPVAVITHPENRWARPDIKSTSLLANVLAKQYAHRHQAYEAIYVTTDGWITEGSHSNVWIVNQDGVLQTHPPTQQILNGVTRQRLISLLVNSNLKIQQEPFTHDDLLQAREVFLTGTTSFIKPVSHVDDVAITPGNHEPLAPFLSQTYLTYCGL